MHSGTFDEAIRIRDSKEGIALCYMRPISRAQMRRA